MEKIELICKICNKKQLVKNGEKIKKCCGLNMVLCGLKDDATSARIEFKKAIHRNVKTSGFPITIGLVMQALSNYNKNEFDICFSLTYDDEPKAIIEVDGEIECEWKLLNNARQEAHDDNQEHKTIESILSFFNY